MIDMGGLTMGPLEKVGSSPIESGAKGDGFSVGSSAVAVREVSPI